MAYRSVSANDGNGTSITVSKPAGAETNDLLLVIIATSDNRTITPPAGWVQTDLPADFTALASTWDFRVYRRTVLAGDPASWAFTPSATCFYNTKCVCLSGRSTSAPITAADVGTSTDTAAPIEVTAPSLTAVAGDDAVLLGGGDWFDNLTSCDDAAYVERADSLGSSAYVEENVGAGATGAKVLTLTGNQNGQAAYHILVAQAPLFPDIEFIANALGATNSTTSFSITLPATQADDILLLEFAHRGTGDGTIGGTSVTTGGLTWALKHSQLFASSAFSGKLYWTRATGDHGGQTVTGSGLTNSCAAIVTVYRNVIASADPFDGAAAIVGEQNASGNETQAEITTLVDKCLVCLTVLNSPDLAVATQACTSPGTLTERAERLSSGGTDSSIAHASAVKAAAGGTGALTWTQTNAASGSYAFALQPPVSATAYTLNAESGSYGYAGTAATLRAARRLSASSASYAYAGTAATLRKGYTLSAASGSFAYAGTAATLRATRTLSAASGAYAFTGTAAGLRRAFTMAADAGTFAYAGTAAGLHASRRLSAASASYAWTGQDAALRAARRLAAGSGSYAWTGTDATLTYDSSASTYTLTAEAGSFGFAGTAVSLRADRRLASAPGSFAYVGTDATLRAGRRLSAASGAMAYTGTAASLRRDARLQAASAAYSWTGTDAGLLYAPAVIQHYRLECEPGAFPFTGSPSMVVVRVRQFPWSPPPDPENWRGPKWEGHPLRGIPIGGSLR